MKKLLLVLTMFALTSFGSEDGRRHWVVELPTAEAEETLMLEDWMTDERIWCDYVNEVEEPLQIEEWMVDMNVWK